GHFVGHHFHRGSDSSKGQVKIELEPVVNLQLDIFCLRSLKALELHPDGIDADREQINVVVAEFIRDCLASYTGPLRDDPDRSPGNSRTGLVGHGPKKIARGLAISALPTTKQDCKTGHNCK